MKRNPVEHTLLGALYAVPLTVTWTVAGAHLALGLAAACGLAWRALRGRWPLQRNAADRAMLAFAAASLLAALCSIDRMQSLVELKKLLLLPVIPLAGAMLATPRRARIALRLCVAAVGITALLAVLRFVLGSHPADERLRSTGHYMTFAGQMLLVAPLAAAAALTLPGRRRLPYVLACLVLALGLLFSFTRSAWIGLVFAACAMLLRARPRLLFLVPPVVLALLVALPRPYRERALSSFDRSHPNNVDRERLWRAGLDILRDHPWTGVGPIDLKPVYRRYRRSPEGVVHGHLHDNWLHVAATLGSLGLLAYAWLMVAFGRLAWRAAAGPRSDDELRALGSGIWGAYWGFQAMGLFEWNFGDVEVTIALYFLLGAGVAAAASSRDERRASGRSAGDSPTFQSPAGRPGRGSEVPS